MSFFKGKNVIILGATSLIAEKTARLMTEAGANILLVGRNQEKLELIKKDLALLNNKSQIEIYSCDLADKLNISHHYAEFLKIFPSPDLVLLAYGAMFSQSEAEKDQRILENIIDNNFVSAAIWLSNFANCMEERKSGTLAVIGSVAGERGRRQHYVYGAAKSALATFTEGLEHRLAPHGAHALIIKPGLVDTPMTSGMKKGKLMAQPDLVAKDILKSIEKGKTEVYTPFFWRFIMLIIKNIPAKIFNKMNI